MNTKLTLTIEKQIIERAKQYAKEKNRSLSDIIANYLKLITEKPEKDIDDELHPLISSLKGSIKDSGIKDYKKELQKRSSSKYLK